MNSTDNWTGLTNDGALADAFKRFAEIAWQQTFSKEALVAVDRVLGLSDGDVLLCDVHCVEYALHAIASEDSPKEVWLIPSASLSQRGVEDVEAAVSELCAVVRESLGETHPEFKGFRSDAPVGPLKQVRSYNGSGSPFLFSLDEDDVWTAISHVAESVGVAFSAPGMHAENWDMCWSPNVKLRGISHIVELTDGSFVLGYDGVSTTCCMEDLSYLDDPWALDVTPLEIAVNDGCLVPSQYRASFVPVEKNELGDLARRIGRGTALTGKELGERRDVSVSRPGAFIKIAPHGGYAVYEGDYFYVDSASISDGEVTPSVLSEIPKGQDRYVVRPGDGHVLLISRNGKQCAFYEAGAPTLIANSVFIVWFEDNVDIAYLRCWIESAFACEWLRNDGRMLAKGTLESLPVPVLDERVSGLVMKRYAAIESKIAELEQELLRLKNAESFAPVAAIRAYSQAEMA